MNRGWLRCVLTAAALLAAMNFLSCGNQRKLVSIAIQPPMATFGGPSSQGVILLTALGTYMQPPDTRDITSKVTWKTDTPQVLAVTAGSVSPTGNGCGVGGISASLSDGGNLIIGYSTITVDDPTNPNCPGGKATQAVVSVTPLGSGTGIVTSTPAGITCPTTTCGASFTVGSPIILTESPGSGDTFGGWGGACTGTTNTCSFVVPTGSTNVTATFN